MSDRLSRPDWNSLDDLLGRHGFGGYYDLVESLKGVAGALGISMAGVDLYPGHSGGESMSLPQIVQYLQDWSSLLTKTKGFTDIAKLAGEDSVLEKGKNNV